MLNIIKTLRNYFSRELLHDNLSSDVTLHFNVSSWQPYLVVSCSEKVFCQPVRPLWLAVIRIHYRGVMGRAYCHPLTSVHVLIQ